MKTLVTGGSGFLGRAVCTRLAEAGYQVRSLSRTLHPQLSKAGIEQYQADIRHASHVAAAAEGCQAVVHCAAKVSLWGSPSDYQTVNVTGTHHVIAACRRHGIDRLVFTSSPSVVIGSTHLEGVDESHPYAARYGNHYGRTKAEAERAVNAADSAGLATVCLRPHAIIGPGDPHLVPRLLHRARSGRLRWPGGGQHLTDFTYIDDAAEHIFWLWRSCAPGARSQGEHTSLARARAPCHPRRREPAAASRRPAARAPGRTGRRGPRGCRGTGTAVPVFAHHG
ncbi:3-beta hydroxysteroid dehydrogenase [Streptosporangium nondiastaticum]|uniref:3-beta hydroxysteroid dehydrogenase n=1 Tax=Streptosporangium nondiastaticum TaxID=35764 RepID=A0A9X7JSL7_9ACTN|nr:NAD(P)-dependent oxidoreductase [Streptosporangium nondiastaticum]PSJ29132.1 3-beta hydroxysteroid dehydrogenase [Streptosporangium nondiastaticum]